MLYKITLSYIDYWYDPEFRILYSDQAGNKPVATKWLSDIDLHEFYVQSEIIQEAFKLSQQ